MPVSTERVQAKPQWRIPLPQPNGLQAVPEGVWVIDQRDGLVALLDWTDGHILRQFPTVTHHASGIGWDGEAVWVASTYTPIELFRYSPDGTLLRRLPTPGASEKSGAHGLEWIEGKLWVTVPPAATTYQLDPETGRVLRQFAAPGTRPHGLAWDGALLWAAETNHRTIIGYTLDGEVRRVLALDPGPAAAPNPHGMTLYQGQFWYCDAETCMMATVTGDKG